MLNLGILLVFRKGISSLLFFTVGIMVASFMFHLTDVDYYATVPLRENMDRLMSYAEPVIDKSDRYYQKGLNWIIIKDFPENIGIHEGIFREESNKLWGYSTR